MLSILCLRLTIKVKVGIPESFKVGWYPPKKTGSSHLKKLNFKKCYRVHFFIPLLENLLKERDKNPNLINTTQHVILVTSQARPCVDP